LSLPLERQLNMIESEVGLSVICQQRKSRKNLRARATIAEAITDGSTSNGSTEKPSATAGAMKVHVAQLSRR